jgi:hypothetical protein
LDDTLTSGPIALPSGGRPYQRHHEPCARDLSAIVGAEFAAWNPLR